MSELRNYILSKLVEEKTSKAPRSPKGEKAVADWKMKRRVGRKGGQVRVGQSGTGMDASLGAEQEAGELTGKLKSRGPRGLGQTSGGMRKWSNIQQGHSASARQNASTDLRTQLAYVLADKLEELKLPKPKWDEPKPKAPVEPKTKPLSNRYVGKPKPENSSTDLRTQLAYVLADKLEELKLPVGGIPRDPSGRVSRDAKRMVAAGGVAIARSGKVPDKPISPDKSGVVDLDKFDRSQWTPATAEQKSAAGKFAVTSKQRVGVTLAPRPERDKKPKREDSSTNLKDRMVDIIIESYLNKLDEARPHGSVANLRRKLGLGYESNPEHKKTAMGQSARDLDAKAMRDARNPDSEAAKINRQIHRDARSSEDPPSRSGGGGTRPSRYTDNHPSLTDSERNSGHRFNGSRSGY